MPDLKRYASELGLDSPAFAECLDSGKFSAEWQQDRRDGEKYGITGTPVLFVNGIPLFGALPFDEVEKVVEDECRRLGDRCVTR